MKPVYLDFETEGIEARPKYPPVPVGLAVYDPEGEYQMGTTPLGMPLATTLPRRLLRLCCH